MPSNTLATKPQGHPVVFYFEIMNRKKIYIMFGICNGLTIWFLYWSRYLGSVSLTIWLLYWSHCLGSILASFFVFYNALTIWLLFQEQNREKKKSKLGSIFYFINLNSETNIEAK